MFHMRNSRNHANKVNSSRVFTSMHNWCKLYLTKRSIVVISIMALGLLLSVSYSGSSTTEASRSPKTEATALSSLQNSGCEQLIDSTASSGNMFDDFTQHTYGVGALPIGGFADCTIRRTFAGPIQSLKVTIVEGQADDIGYVGSLQVTDTPPQCARIGIVQTPIDVTSQVSVNGSTASLVLRAQENCCCVNGWGPSAFHQPNALPAKLRWEVALEPETCVPPPSGMVAWLPGDGNANDIIGDNEGTLQNGATFAAGKVAQAFSLDGMDDYVSVANTPSLDFGTGDFTLDLWVNFASFPAAPQTLFGKVLGQFPDDKSYFLEYNHEGAGFDCGVGGCGLRFVVRDTRPNDNDLIVPVSLQTGTWYHIAGVRTGNTSLLYLNGALVGQQTAGNNMDTGAGGTAIIGRNPDLDDATGRFVSGRIDELEAFNRALPASEIQAIYNAGSMGKCKNISPAEADLQIMKNDKREPVLTGQPLNYDIRFRNNGPATATGVVVTDQLPAGVTFLSASFNHGGTQRSCAHAAGVVTCNIGDLPSGDTGKATIRTLAPLTRGKVTNTATIMSAATDPIPANNTAQETTTIKTFIFSLLGRDSAAGCVSLPGKINLSSPAGAGGETIMLTSSCPEVNVPSSVMFSQGESKMTFPISIGEVTVVKRCMITAKRGKESDSKKLRITPAGPCP